MASSTASASPISVLAVLNEPFGGQQHALAALTKEADAYRALGARVATTAFGVTMS